MRRFDRNIIVLACLLLFGAGLLLCSMAQGQTVTMPIYASQDPAYWYSRAIGAEAKAEKLEQSGKTAIDGLKASLKAANDTITKQNRTIVLLVGERDYQIDRAVVAETALKPVKNELDEYKGRTVAGKALRKIGEGLKYVGGVTVVVLAIRAAIP